MKSGIVCTIALSFMLVAVVPSQVMAEEMSSIAQVTELLELPQKETEVVTDSLLPTTEEEVKVDGGSQIAESMQVPDVQSYTEEDLDILAHAICGEAQTYPDEEQLYVGSVILNRKNHSAYPNTIKGVVFQRGQYACTWDGNYYRQPTPANYANAKWLFENGSILPGNVVYQAAFKQGSGVYLATKYHKYCYR